MFPFVFEWVNDGSHFLFMGTLYTVLFLLVVIMHYCGIRAIIDWACKSGSGHDEHH